MKTTIFNLVLIMAAGMGSLSHAQALAIDPPSVHAVVEGKVYRGGVTVKKGTYGVPITDFSYVCQNNFTLVVNAYSKAPSVQKTCPDGRTITYLGDHWDTAVSPADDIVVGEIRRQGKVLVHCVNGVDASQEVAYIVAAKAGLMSPQEAYNNFLHGPSGLPSHAGKFQTYILQRGQPK